MRIAITDNHRPKLYFDRYIHWIQRVESTTELIKLSYHFNNGHLVSDLDALILTGGGDVHPALYGKERYIEQTVEVNEKRDEFEFGVIERALDAEIPILGICRGMQIMNVYLNGTLILDLPGAGYMHHLEVNGVENRHEVAVAEPSMIRDLTLRQSLNVNSIHHQAVDQLGKGLMVSSTSPDGVIESAEWIMKDRMPFLLLLQWHPERMDDFGNPASGKMAEAFISAVRQTINQ